MIIILFYYVMINAALFVLMGIDKQKAAERGRRVPEKRLFALAAAGGALGGWVGMRYYRHKTKHTSFKLLFPLLTTAHVLVWLLLTKNEHWSFFPF